jgi:hypothetical protein
VIEDEFRVFNEGVYGEWFVMCTELGMSYRHMMWEFIAQMCIQVISLGDFMFVTVDFKKAAKWLVAVSVPTFPVLLSVEFHFFTNVRIEGLIRP